MLISHLSNSIFKLNCFYKKWLLNPNLYHMRLSEFLFFKPNLLVLFLRWNLKKLSLLFLPNWLVELSKQQVQKFQVVNAITKAWILQGDVVISQLDKYKNIFSFSFTLAEDRDGIWSTIVWHVKNHILVLKEWDHTLTLQ